MPRHQRRDPMFRYRRHEDEIIVLAVRWYISYRLSLRDLVEMLAERGLEVYPSTIWRWVQRYVPEFEKRWDARRRQTGSSWRVDETYVRIRGRWLYLYRAVDKQGRTIDFLLRPDRGIAAAQAFFRKAVATNGGHGPRKVTLDGHAPSRRALWLLRREALFWRHVEVRTNRYLNNIIEQDHRAIKRRCSAMHGFKSVPAATIAIAGIELAHRIRKNQFRLGHARGRRRHSMLTAWNRAIFAT
jgi:transposase-like protein